MYCSLDDLLARVDEATLVALADDDGDGAVDAGVIEAAATDASAEIDAALAGRYAVPFSPVPDLIRGLCASLAADALFRRRRETPSAAHAVEAERSRALLRLLASGDIALAGVTPSALPASNRRTRDKATRPSTLKNM